MALICCICTEEMNSTSEIYSIYCGHTFHHHCIARWFQSSSSCPQCRRQLDIKCRKEVHQIYLEFKQESRTTNPNNNVLKNQIKSLQSKLAQHKTLLDEQNKRICTASQENSYLQSQIEEIENNASFQLNVKSNEKRVLTKHIQAIEKNLNNYKTKLDKQIQETEFFKNTYDQHIMSLACEIETLNNKIKYLENNNTTTAQNTRHEIIQKDLLVQSSKSALAAMKKVVTDAENEKKLSDELLQECQNKLLSVRNDLKNAQNENRHLYEKYEKSQDAWQYEKREMWKLINTVTTQRRQKDIPLLDTSFYSKA